MTYIISLHLITNIGYIDPLSFPMKIFTYSLHMDSSNTPNHGNSIPSPPTFAVNVDGNFHAFPWLGDNYLIFENICAWHTPLIYHIWKKMDIWRSRLTTWHSLPVCPIALSLIWNLVEKTSRIYAGLFGNIYISNLIKT